MDRCSPLCSRKENAAVTLWEVDIHPALSQPDHLARSVLAAARDLGLGQFSVHAARGFLIQGEISAAQIGRIARELLVDLVVEMPVVGRPGEAALNASESGGRMPTVSGNASLIHVLPKPGVTDPVAASTLTAIADFGIPADAVVTLRKYWIGGLADGQLKLLANKLLANDSIEQVVFGPLHMERIHFGSRYEFQQITVPIRALTDEQLIALNKACTLSLSLAELKTVQQHYRDAGREPTDIELETIAQTWSEHCSHKTLTGRVTYTDEHGTRQFNNLLKETIFAATERIRRDLGEQDWCVSVFRDNAGVVRFDDEFNVAFKVETHNRPSAIEPYGGANTGVGGVIRDTLGTGLGAKPICNTDVFCFAPPDTPETSLPPGVLHPRRIMRSVVSGVRDYGNRMGIPTVNGAIYFDPRYIGNPLVFCGNVGLIPRDKSFKEARPGDLIVAIGGRTGRDGIHGATFSSVELTQESEKTSGGAVQIGNAITEKMVADALLKARDEGLYSAITDCGAGGFSSAVGEMGAEIGAEVWLDRAPLKYAGLSYTEIWISEAQERMVLAVPEENWPRLEEICKSENVEATVLGRFVPTGSLHLKYQGTTVGQLDMHFLHEGRPKVERQATYKPSAATPQSAIRNPQSIRQPTDFNATLLRLLSSLNIASKEWVIRQYDHEVQGGSVIKPLVGAANDGPSDAAVLRPVLSSRRGLVIACGMNPLYGDYDTYHMAACAIDEAVRNCVAVGADPSRIAILDNFCWGQTDRPETLGALVRAALACYDVALAYGTPFVSGKDSLNNEFTYETGGQRQTIQIPHTLLISALGQVDDVRRCVTMDLKSPGNSLYQIGVTKAEMAGSHYELLAAQRLSGGHVPQVDVTAARKTFAALHQAIHRGLIRACHDLSEGGLAVAIAEMAFAGACGAFIRLADVPQGKEAALSRDDLMATLLFSESASRFLVEVPPDSQVELEKIFTGANVPFANIGQVTAADRLQISWALRDDSTASPSLLIDLPIAELKDAWQKPLRW
jgi:phosphoribosylformylglycinamidine synthase